MSIGYFGEVVFEVSSDKQLTPEKFSYSKKSKWAEHETLNVKTKSEFLGDGKKNYSISIKLSAFMGINPQNELDKIEYTQANGLVEPLFIGSKYHGDFYIDSINVQNDRVDGKGSLLACTVDLNLVEYSNETLADVKKRIEAAKKKQAQRRS